MMRKFVSATASAALCLMSVTPAMAENYRFTGFDAPAGATATLNLRVPLGHQAQKTKTTYGLTFGYGQVVGGPSLDGRTTTRAVKLGDIRFADGFKLQRAEVATFDLANLKNDRRLGLTEGGDNTVWIVVGLVAAGVAVCLLADCFGGDDDDDDDSED